MNTKNIALGERIRRARKTLGLTQQDFADRLAVTQPTVHRWEKGFYDPDEDALRRLGELTKLSPAYFRYGEEISAGTARPISIIGYVGPGAEIHDHADVNGTPHCIEVPPGESLTIVAATIRGDGLYPVYQDGDAIFYSREGAVDEASFVDRECVVRVVGGGTLLRRVLRGSQRGRYTLIAHNAPPMNDVKLEWASVVRWIRRA
jgi:transcriptional regulator with XRE-family HTH domain